MKQEDYPALYISANAASMRAQQAFLRSIKWFAIANTLGAALSLVSMESAKIALLAAFIFLASLAISLLVGFKRFEDIWYRTRAVAESVKTISWRFMMCAEPFTKDLTDAAARTAFSARLGKILDEHKDLAGELDSAADEESITREMERLRAATLRARIDAYTTHRIAEQRQWYTSKAAFNKRQGVIWFSAVVMLQIGAVGSALLRIYEPSFKFWPVEVFAVAAAGALTWMQVKRFRELSAAYSLTAHEIGLLSVELKAIGSDESFSGFVQNAENAFSREHTQWIARKDY